MAEAIKINLLDPVADKNLWHTAQNFQGNPDTVYVFVHGSPTEVVDYSKGRANPVFLGPLDLAKRLDEAGATRESKVFLFACTTGQGMHSFARELSQYYSVVEGATRQVRTRASSESEFYEEAIIAGPDRHGQPNLHDLGKMKYYFGADYRFCNANPQKCDPPESERPPRTNEYKLLNVTIPIQEVDHVRPITFFRPGQASKPISPDEAIQLREAMANLFTNIVELKGVPGQLARHQAVHHYPELAYAFAAFDNSVQLSKRQPAPKEYLGEAVAAISFAIKQGETYALDTGANAKTHVTPTMAAEAQAYSR